jgi:hypothetical protein
MPAYKGGAALFGNAAPARGIFRGARRPRRREHALPTPHLQQHPSDTRLALRRSRGASGLQPGFTLGRSVADVGAGYVFYNHRRCRRLREGETSKAAAGGVGPVNALARDPQRGLEAACGSGVGACIRARKAS